MFGASAATLLSAPAHAWTLPEHSRISQSAFVSLGEDEVTKARWHEFRGLIDQRLQLCDETHDKATLLPRKEGNVACVPIQALPALAADHSCTPGELKRDLELPGDSWVRDVLDEGEATDKELRRAGQHEAECAAACVKDCEADPTLPQAECKGQCAYDCERRTDREAIRRQMHVDLQFADSRYVERALVDYSHFQGPRTGPLLGTKGLEAYLAAALAPGTQANATAAYVNFHVAAVRYAIQARQNPAKVSYFATWALLSEAFALHFLEDSFSSGHFVGHWGDAATRLGTHDYYSSAGFQATRWSAEQMFVAKGDAFLDDRELPTIASAVRASLWQVVLAATDDKHAAQLWREFGQGEVSGNSNACEEKTVARGLAGFSTSKLIKAVIKDEPVPAARNPEVMRVSAENGVFVGAAATLQAGWVRLERGWNAKVMAGLRVGYGAAGLVNDSLNAQLFGEVGFLGERLYDGRGTSITGFSFRLRLPGYFLPDGIIAIPLALALESDCPGCIEWAAADAAGGLGRFWRSHRISGRLNWQISALRDASITIFRNQPTEKQHRNEILLPAVTLRYFWPTSGGTSWAQSTDLYFDVGPSITFGNDHDRRWAWWGAFASLSVSPRVFPP